MANKEKIIFKYNKEFSCNIRKKNFDRNKYFPKEKRNSLMNYDETLCKFEEYLEENTSTIEDYLQNNLP